MTQQTKHPDDDSGVNDPGAHGEDRDIVGKRQEDLTVEDLKGDSRNGQNPEEARKPDNSDPDLS